MKPYLNDGDVTLYLGDALEVLEQLPARSVHSVVTDPPYGIGFLGAAWDTPTILGAAAADAGRRERAGVGPHHESRPGREQPRSSSAFGSAAHYAPLKGGRAFQEWVEAWGRLLVRVMLPGAHALVFGSPRTFHRLTVGLEDAGLTVVDTVLWLHGQGFPKARTLAPGVTTALKPGWEPVMLLRAPLEERSLTAQHAATRTGGLNTDACKLGTEVIPTNGWRAPDGAGALARHVTGGMFANGTEREQTHHVGRWPANVTLDEPAAEQLDVEAAGGRGNGRGPYVQPRATTGAGPATFTGAGHVPFHYGDAGGPSRFYFTAKASTSERDGSDHPTVKPRSLMRWLARLVTPPGGVVLDPFAGSGTTLLAARDEGLRAIGIEREPAHAADAAHRLRQLSLFGLEQGETPATAGLTTEDE